MADNDAPDQGCPACGAEDIKQVPERAHAYQCVNCGALFDAETGERLTG